MKKKKILGYSMLIAFYFGSFLLVALTNSFLDALIVFVTATLSTGFILLATYLIAGDKS